MKVIFLDIDGVLNSDEFFDMRQESQTCARGWVETDDFDPHAIGLLNKVIESTDAKIVVSSAWRIGRTVEELQELLHGVGIKGEIIDRTKNFGNVDRGEEIQNWLDRHVVDRFVIFDDEFDMTGLKDSFVKTSFKTGLTDYHVDLAIKRLSE